MDEQIDEQETGVTITLDQMIDLLPKRVTLSYVDYRDNLDENLDKLQECITEQDYYPIDEFLQEWFWESEADSIDYIFKELCYDLARHYDITDEDAQSLIEENEDQLKDVLHNRDESNPLGDLLRNTDDPIVFYDTGFEVDSESWQWERSEMRNWRERVKRALKIPAKEHKYDRDIVSMLADASYGGRLVVYFHLYLSDFEQFLQLQDFNIIQFKNPAIAIINTFNGSGADTSLPGHTFQLPIDKDNLTFEKTIKYNYTYEVCAMFSNWCECTEYQLLNVEKPKKIKKSTINQEKEQEKRYNKTYQMGGCTFGDMDIHRHRNVYYDNNFPCGSHCPHCQTFWID